MSTSGLTFDEFASAHLDALLRFATALTTIASSGRISSRTCYFARTCAGRMWVLGRIRFHTSDG